MRSREHKGAATLEKMGKNFRYHEKVLKTCTTCLTLQGVDASKWYSLCLGRHEVLDDQRHNQGISGSGYKTVTFPWIVLILRLKFYEKLPPQLLDVHQNFPLPQLYHPATLNNIAENHFQ